MAIQATAEVAVCPKCNITFGTHEPRETHKGQDYHPDCWASVREGQLRLLLRSAALPTRIADILRR